MYKLLIVDDEALIRNGLKNLIEWEVYGIEIAGEAEDGMKAYFMIKDLQPDIVLVDISMPNVTGLEVMDMCCHLEQPPKFIILSGYNDFQFVQKAMQLGAINYLLKPVNQEELMQTVISASKLLDNLAAHRQQFQESLDTLRTNVLVRILHNRIDSRELREKCQVVSISLHCSHMRVALLKPLVKGVAATLYPAIKLCEQLCLKFCPCYAFADTDDCIAIIFKDQTNSLKEEDYHSLLNSCAEALCEQFDFKTIPSLGKEAAHLQELSNSYEDCISKIEKALILGTSFEEEISGKSFSSIVSYPDFLHYMETDNKEEIQDSLHRCFTDILISEEGQDINILKYHLIELVTYILHSKFMITFSDSEIGNLKKTAFSIISNTNSVLHLEESLRIFFLSLLEHTTDNASFTEYSFMIQNALSFVNQNFTDNNLSLKTLAANMEVNAAYLGREFARETGEFFNDYLNRIRIAKAVHLLTGTTWKTSKIANSVGFINISYFFTIFKKITGKSPGDYRSTHA
ncbi:MAG: response regulator [Eubacteriales bacterium]|nr:response regulator [Eubacteriales bacterium]